MESPRSTRDDRRRATHNEGNAAALFVEEIKDELGCGKLNLYPYAAGS